MSTAPSPAELFQEENGMTVEEAWAKVTEWNLAGKKAEALRGAEIILTAFPDHPAKDLVAHLRGGNPAARKSIAEKLGGAFADSVEGLVKKKKSKTAALKESAPMPAAEKEPVPTETVETVAEAETIPSAPVLDDERLFAAISYAWIFCIIPLLLKRDSVFVQFHAKQGLVMAILLTVFDFTVGALLNVLLGGIGFLLKLIYIGVLAFAAYQAYQGKYWKIPLIYSISKKIKF